MQRYFANKLKDNYFILSDNDLYHIKVVMRMKKNDLIEVVYKQQLYLSKIENDFKIKCEKMLACDVVNKKEYILCLPLLSEQKMSFVLQKATELGVDKIIPIITKRSIVKLTKEKEIQKLKRWNLICKEASEQSKRLTVPIIDEIKTLSELKFDGLKIVCSTTNGKPLKEVLKTSYTNVVMVVGPEGGLEPSEELLLNELGFISTSFGSNILRVETAPIYLLSILKYEE